LENLREALLLLRKVIKTTSTTGFEILFVLYCTFTSGAAVVVKATVHQLTAAATDKTAGYAITTLRFFVLKRDSREFVS